jgi:hypothetical protein
MKTPALVAATFLLLAACNQTTPTNTTPAKTVNTDSLEHARAWYAPRHCYYTNLSRQFNLAVDVQRFAAENDNDSTIVWLRVKNKTTGTTTDSFMVSSLYFYYTIFTACDSVTSYATGYHANKTIVDNMFGDIVVADLNFDGLDDIAVTNDGGGNGGPLYSYYLQQYNGTFERNAFLSDTMIFYPTVVDSVKSQLTTHVHAGAYGYSVNVFQYYPDINRWEARPRKIVYVN